MRRATPDIGMDRLTTTENDKSVSIVVDHQVRHIPDPDGLGRRTFEGWASIDGIDFQNESTPPEAFVEAITEYMAKNPVLVWHHKLELPIGKILKADVVFGKGVYVVGEVFRSNNTAYNKMSPSKVPALRDLADQVWEMLKTGTIRGLSWRGDTLKLKRWSKEEQQLYTENAHLLNLIEISLTPTQVHPGSQVVGVNTTAKALNTPAQGAEKGESQMADKNALNESVDGVLQGLAQLEDGAQISQEILDKIGSAAKACGFDINTPATEPVEPSEPAAAPFNAQELAQLIAQETAKALKPIQEKVEKLSTEPAPRLSVGATDPNAAQTKPGEETGMPQKMSLVDACAKALAVLSDADPDNKDFQAIMAGKIKDEDLLKMHSLVRQAKRGDNSYLMRNDKKGHLQPDISLHSRTIRVLRKISQPSA